MNIPVAEDHAKYERLRYVTENFQSLQGLTWVALGGALFLSETEHIPGIAHPWWLGLLTNSLGFTLALAAIRYVPMYYERRFGSVEWRVGPPNAKTPIFALAVAVMFLVILFFGPAMGRYLDSVVPELSNVAHRIISDPDHRANLAPALFSLAVLCAGISGRPRGLGRQRTVFYCVNSLLWTGVLTFLPLRHPEVTQQVLWRIFNAGWFGINLLLMGLYDHLMLVNLMPARGQTNVNE